MPAHPDSPGMHGALGNPASSAMGKELGVGVSCTPSDGWEAGGHILGLVIHPPFPLHRPHLTHPPAAVLRVEQSRRAECWAWRGQDDTEPDATNVAPAAESTCPGREGGRQRSEVLCSTLGSPLPGAGEADRIITAAIWAHGLIPLPFAFCIMDRL